MNIRADFPIFSTYPDLVYLDSAATSQKPQTVIDAVSDFYIKTNANVHRGIYDLSQLATDQFESARQKVAHFIGANRASEIIFTANATESINFVTFGWAQKNLSRGDIIVTSVMEHHSNFVPWLQLKEKIGVELVVLPIDADYRLDYRQDMDFARVKLVALAHASNVLGTINPIAEIAAYFRDKAPQAKILIDAAQSVPHTAVNVRELDADFLAFSAHKMLGPSGVGVLYGKGSLLDSMDPMLVGSHMIESVTEDQAIWADAPDKFEPGTRNLEGVIGLAAAIDYLQSLGMQHISQYEQELTAYALEKLSGDKSIKIFGPINTSNRLAVFSFAVGSVHPHDSAEILNRSQVAVRAGHHCAQPLMEVMGVPGTTRASFYLYNTKQDVDALARGIAEIQRVFRV